MGCRSWLPTLIGDVSHVGGSGIESIVSGGGSYGVLLRRSPPRVLHGAVATAEHYQPDHNTGRTECDTHNPQRAGGTRAVMSDGICGETNTIPCTVLTTTKHNN